MKIPPPYNLSEVLRDIQMGMHSRWYCLDDDSLVEYVPYELSSKQQAINKLRSKLPQALSDERKRKEVEEKQRQVQQLEQELGRQKTTQTKVNKARTHTLLDIKEAVEIKPQDYSKAIDTKEFQFVQKPRDGVAGYYPAGVTKPPHASPPSASARKGRRGFSSTYDLA